MKLSNKADGTATGALISVDQGGVEIPIAAVVQKDAHLQLVVPAVIGNYEGDLKDGQFTGMWTQGPNMAAGAQADEVSGRGYRRAGRRLPRSVLSVQRL